MMDTDDINISSLVTTVIKEEKFDYEEACDYESKEEKKFDPPKRGRTRSLSKKSADKVDIKAKLERSRQSARECRARKKLRYQYLEEIISETEKAIFSLRREMEMMKFWAKEIDEGRLPENLIQYRTSCVEKKLTNPFKLQHHHQVQLQFQRQQAKELAAAGASFSQSPSSAAALGSGGGICVSPSSSTSMGITGLSLSPTANITPYMTLGHFGRRSMPSSSASASHSSVSPP